MTTGLQLQSNVTASGVLEITLEDIEFPAPGENEVLIRVEASPVNPSDLGLLLAGADLSASSSSGTPDRPKLTASLSPAGIAAAKARLDQPLPVGNEGAGVVVEAGDAPEAQALMGKTVAVLGGAMYAQYRVMPARNCLVLPDGVTPREAASCFVNPLTALGMVETMKLEGHSALVHTAAASNLGQMLLKLCQTDGVPLVNIVRKQSNVDLLRALGAEHVCNSEAPDFLDSLTDALDKTGATLAFDAIAGGPLASDILSCMERVAARNPRPEDRYGSTTHKQVYLYGVLETGPTVLDRSYGMAWGVGGWLMPNFLTRIGAERAGELRARVAREITGTFASEYTAEISLAGALDAETARGYQRKATGEKYLIAPWME